MVMTPDTAGASRFGINPRTTGFDEIEFAKLFGNEHPVVFEIGSGKGRFLLQSARQRPDVNFVGVEKSLHYYRVIVQRLEKSRLENVRIVNYDAFLVMQKMLRASSIDEIHIYFPDPWPRKREQKRRIIRDEVLEQIDRVLKRGGVGVYVTDHGEYFEAALPVLERRFSIEVVDALQYEPRTNYEAKYRTEGRPIYQVNFRHRG